MSCSTDLLPTENDTSYKEPPKPLEMVIRTYKKMNKKLFKKTYERFSKKNESVWHLSQDHPLLRPSKLSEPGTPFPPGAAKSYSGKSTVQAYLSCLQMPNAGLSSRPEQSQFRGSLLPRHQSQNRGSDSDMVPWIIL